MLFLRRWSVVRLVVAAGFLGSLSLSFAEPQPQSDTPSPSGSKPSDLPISMNGDIRRYMHSSQSAGCLPNRYSKQETVDGQSP
jgi:hypothetical protein